MEEDKLAKNILADRTCYKCIYYVWEQGDVEFCEKNVNRNNNQYNQHDPLDPYIGTEPIPPELTCEYWTSCENINFSNANEQETKMLAGQYGYRND